MRDEEEEGFPGLQLAALLLPPLLAPDASLHAARLPLPGPHALLGTRPALAPRLARQGQLQPQLVDQPALHQQLRQNGGSGTWLLFGCCCCRWSYYGFT